ncbi:MAG: tetraacyldisaccharide 4'-kinase [Phycisphaerales bacterium]|nr:MAG: tetraacyldisaccharide 4'-kinase [Phycisphaerales bacterium]
MSGPLPELLRPITLPLSWVYGRVIARRNARFDRGERVERFEVPVISIGNITTGGTGKTPMVMWLAQHLREGGRHPAIAMRGYGGSRDEPGDEEREYRDALPDVPVIAAPERCVAIRAHLNNHPDTDVILLDDGFQHRFVARDLELVLIDAKRNTMRDALLPAGHLREPLDSLARADAVIVTRADDGVDAELAARIERYHGRMPLAWARHRWSHLDIHVPGETARTAPPNWLNGRGVITMLGVGHPEAVQQQIESLGAKILANLPVRDHERYDVPQLSVARGLCDGAKGFIITMKDWVKIRELIDPDEWPCPIIVPRVAMEIFRGRQELETLVMDRIRAAGSGAAGRNR